MMGGCSTAFRAAALPAGGAARGPARGAWLANDYLLTVLIIILYFAYTGQAWNIMMGFAGQLSLGHAIYVGLGGYAAAALYVHFGVGPWIGLAGGDRGRDGLRRDHRLSRVPFRRRRRLFRHPHHRVRRIRAHRLRPFQLGRRIRRLVPAGRELFPERHLEPARQADHVLLRDPRADGRAPFCCAMSCCAAGWATTGRRFARTRRRRARSASIPSATRCIAVVISAGMTSVAGVFFAFYYNNLFPGAGVQHRRARSRSSSARSSAASAPCSGPIVGAFLLTGLAETMRELLRALGLDVPGAQAGVLRRWCCWWSSALPAGVWPWLARLARPGETAVMTALLRIDGVSKRFRGLLAVDKVSFQRGAGLDLRGHRSERRGQDDAVQHHCRRARAGPGFDHLRR